MDQLATDSFMELDLLLSSYFSLNFGDDLGVGKIVPTASFLNTLNERMVDESPDVLLPSATLWEELLHHFTLQSVGK